MKIVLWLYAILAAALVVLALRAEPAGADTPTPAVFFSPHQDDETLSMGADIVNHVKAGRPVIVVLLTDGGSTGVQRTFPTWSDRDKLVAERDREFNAAVTRLGATPEIWVSPSGRPVDGSLTVAQAREAMQHYADKYPGAPFKSMSHHDSSRDHANSGKALQQMKYPDARYYLKRTDWGKAKGWHPKQQDIREALLDYAPVGWLSVAGSMYREYTSPGGSKNKVHR